MKFTPSLVAYGHRRHLAICSGTCRGCRVAATRIDMDGQPQVVWFVGVGGAGRHVRVARRKSTGNEDGSLANYTLMVGTEPPRPLKH